jgi:hypothetical protein
MDPNATLAALIDALECNNVPDAQVAFSDLIEWLQKGGFSPKRPARAGLGS